MVRSKLLSLPNGQFGVVRLTSAVTLDLVRKKAEHNNGELSTLEELSLHQLEIER